MIEFTHPAFKDTGCLPKAESPEEELEIWKNCVRDLDAQLTKAIMEKNAVKKELATTLCKLNNYTALLKSKALI